MDLEFRRCLPGHLMFIHAQEAQRHELAVMVTPEYAEAITSGLSLSAWAGNACVGAAGITHIYPHRAIAWAMLGRDAGPYITRIVHKMRRVIRESPIPRIEMTVSVDFAEGHRLAKAVGLELETPKPLRKFGATGGDEMMYVRIR